MTDSTNAAPNSEQPGEKKIPDKLYLELTPDAAQKLALIGGLGLLVIQPNVRQFFLAEGAQIHLHDEEAHMLLQVMLRLSGMKPAQLKVGALELDPVEMSRSIRLVSGLLRTAADYEARWHAERDGILPEVEKQLANLDVRMQLEKLVGEVAASLFGSRHAPGQGQ